MTSSARPLCQGLVTLASKMTETELRFLEGSESHGFGMRTLTVIPIDELGIADVEAAAVHQYPVTKNFDRLRDTTLIWFEAK
jgi:hypothetical protein